MFTINKSQQLTQLASMLFLGLVVTNVSATCVAKATHPKPAITIQSVQCLPEADQFLVAVAENNISRVQQLFRRQFSIDYRSANRELIKFVNVRADKLNRYIVGKRRYEYASGTAYDIALSQGYVKMAIWLLAQGANPAAGFFQRHIESTNFAKSYPIEYLNLPYKQRARLISAGVVLSNAVKENDPVKAANVLRIVPQALHYQNNGLLPQIIRLGKWEVAKAFLQHGKDIELLKDYVSMLRILITSQPTNYQMLELFLQRVYQSKKVDFFPLFMQALEKGDKRTMKLLVKYQTNINVKDKKPPLVLMAEQENNDMIRFLLDIGADPNMAYSGQTLIHRAIANSELPLAQALIAKRVNVNVKDAYGRTPVQIAMHKKDARLAKLLIDHGANVHVKDSEKNSLLHLAAKTGKPRIAIQLMAKRVNIHQKNESGETALLVAVAHDQLIITQALLNASASPHISDDIGNSPLGVALRKKDLRFAKLLIAKKVNINKVSDNRESPLMTAVRKENIPLLKLLISSGVKQKTVDKQTGNTPLHIAVMQKDTTVLQLLLAAKADVNALNTSKRTPLHYAVSKGDEKLVQLLMAHKPKLMMLDENEVTPLHMAVSNHNVLITRILLNAGANPNSVDKAGNTPLLTALLARKLDLAQYLLQKGAEVNVANNRETTPLDVALSKGLRKIATTMRGLGAQTSVELGAASSLRVQLVNGVKK